mmetsp:Transcript_56793/g.122784  ORF Transcript_56793/g.122784 Transcript_56793/m.122784 type:complete len:206 (-) Transcript_56793:81-698(-)
MRSARSRPCQNRRTFSCRLSWNCFGHRRNRYCYCTRKRRRPEDCCCGHYAPSPSSGCRLPCQRLPRGRRCDLRANAGPHAAHGPRCDHRHEESHVCDSHCGCGYGSGAGFPGAGCAADHHEGHECHGCFGGGAHRHGDFPGAAPCGHRCGHRHGHHLDHHCQRSYAHARERCHTCRGSGGHRLPAACRPDLSLNRVPSEVLRQAS